MIGIDLKKLNRDELISKITRAFDKKIFDKKMISKINYPFFKNFEKNTEIQFQFPVTVIVGKNGNGKSSIIHSLFGAPKGQNLGDLWFGTATDEIPELKGDDRPCFIYTYFDNDGTENEVLRMRIKREGDPDYWTTEKPKARLGMKMLEDRRRSSPIDMSVFFHDFKNNISPFDVFLYLKHGPDISNNRNKNQLIEAKRTLRFRSQKLKNVFVSNDVYSSKSGRINSIPVAIPDEVIRLVEYVLNKKYVSAKIVRHRFYDNAGDTVLIKVKNADYTEAFAGSGEIAVFKLLFKLHVFMEQNKDFERKLILLDEPEVALHPDAQKKIFLILLSCCLNEKIQIVMATHSPFFLEGLPPNSIKLVNTSEIDGSFRVNNECEPMFAFEEIGADFSKIQIYVEDSLAKKVVDEVIKTNPSLEGTIVVDFYPGGSETMLKECLTLMKNKNKDVFLLLDGDKFKSKLDPIDSYKMVSEHSNLEINKVLKKYTSLDYEKYIPKDGDDSERTGRIHQSLNMLYRYLDSNLFFFDFNTPEEAIWSDEILINLMKEDFPNANEEKIKQVMAIKVYKARYKIISEITCRPYDEIVSRFLRNYPNRNKDLKIKIERVLKEIVAKVKK